MLVFDMEEAGAVDGAGGAGGAAAAGAAATVPAAEGGDKAAAGGASDGAPPAYAPNFKYKASNEEKELPEWARPFLTSAEIEKNLKDTFARADGLPTVKEHRDQLIAENAEMRTHWAPVIQNVQTVLGTLQRKDYDTFFEQLNIPKHEIMKWTLTQLKLMEQPDQLAAYNAQREAANRAMTLEEQVQNLTAQLQQGSVQQLSNEIDTAIASGEAAAAAQAFDARMGTPGSFRAEVIRRGKAHDAAGQPVPPSQVVAEILHIIGWQSGGTGVQATAGGAAGAAGGAGATGGTVAAPAQKPVLPTIRGKGTSPAKTVIKSTDELRKLSRQFA